MKRLFLFLTMSAMVVSLNSCSSDDSSSVGGTVTAKIDGVAKTFDNVSVAKETYTDEGESYTEIVVTARIGASTTEMITFTVDEGDTGADALWTFGYTKDAKIYTDTGSFTTAVQKNNGGSLTGTFSGTVSHFASGSDIVITDGTFSVSH